MCSNIVVSFAIISLHQCTFSSNVMVHKTKAFCKLYQDSWKTNTRLVSTMATTHSNDTHIIDYVPSSPAILSSKMAPNIAFEIYESSLIQWLPYCILSYWLFRFIYRHIEFRNGAQHRFSLYTIYTSYPHFNDSYIVYLYVLAFQLCFLLTYLQYWREKRIHPMNFVA